MQQTAWRSLRGFATAQGIPKPGLVTREVVEACVHHRRFDEGKAPRTVNEQRRKLGQIYTAASKAKLLGASPVVDIETLKVTRRERATLKRLPFSDAELQKWFSCPIFTQHLRSGGQAGEATYWLPVLMYYTGARPVELAGLDVSDVRCSREHGHYLRITDLPDAEDAMLQWNRDDRDVSRRDMVASAPREDSAGKRRIKNERSRRSIPIAREVIELGFLAYAESVRVSGHGRLFPTLRPSCKGKVSDAVLKALGRYLRDAGIDDTRKTMYSFRHTMKMLLEDAGVESKLLQRILGHATGDGAITDGYGVDVPLGVIAGAFAKVQFPAIPALPWCPGVGTLRARGQGADGRSADGEEPDGVER
jgi:integrase